VCHLTGKQKQAQNARALGFLAEQHSARFQRQRPHAMVWPKQQ
jgi:hypothetical protein